MSERDYSAIRMTPARAASGECPPWNFGADHGASRRFHGHMAITPRLNVPGGFEIGTATHMNTVAPELAAVSLRKVRLPEEMRSLS